MARNTPRPTETTEAETAEARKPRRVKAKVNREWYVHHEPIVLGDGQPAASNPVLLRRGAVVEVDPDNPSVQIYLGGGYLVLCDHPIATDLGS
jgi:hypothetical protein